MSLHGVALARPRYDEERIVRKRSDARFALLGLGVLVLSMIVLMSLIVDFMVDGLGRIDYDFFMSFPSRRPADAGILSAWVGTGSLISSRSTSPISPGSRRSSTACSRSGSSSRPSRSGKPCWSQA